MTILSISKSENYRIYSNIQSYLIGYWNIFLYSYILISKVHQDIL